MRKIFACLPLLFLLSSCGLKIDDAVVIYDSNASAQGTETPLAESPANETSEEDVSPPDDYVRPEVDETPVPNDASLEIPLPTGTETPLEISNVVISEPETVSTPAPSFTIEREEENADPISKPTDAPALELTPGPSEFPTPESTEEPGSISTADIASLSNKLNGWYYNRNDTHEPPSAQRDIDLGLYNALYLGDTSQKKIYLTFDAGYEFGFTSQILDTLKEKRVSAAFFIPLAYVKAEPELSARMAAEGHVVANHSARHISFPTLTDEEIVSELNDTANYFAETTGYPMDPFFRPPAGEYSERTLALTKNEGYTTVFWSFAYQDWLTEEQPDPSETFNRVIGGLHNGAVILLHAVSEANTAALPDIIDAVRAEGYEFGSLYELRE